MTVTRSAATSGAGRTDHALSTTWAVPPTWILGVSKGRGGLGWGTGPVSLVLAVVIAALVACLAAQHRRRTRPAVVTD